MQIQFDGRIIDVENGTRIKDVVKDEVEKSGAIAARFNNEIKSLNYRLNEDGNLSLIDISDKDGIRVYRKGLLFVIGMAVEELYPEAKMGVNYQLSNSLLCEFENLEVTDEVIERINQKVAEIVSKNLPIEKKSMSKEEAEEFYKDKTTMKGRLQLDLIDDNSAKLSKIVNKSTIKGGKTQLNLHDGKNVIIDEDAYSVGDVISLKVPEQEIGEVYPLQEGATVLVTGGKHTGELGTVTEIIENKSSNPNTIIIENSSKDDFLTLKDYAFVVGTDAPSISLLEVNK